MARYMPTYETNRPEQAINSSGPSPFPMEPRKLTRREKKKAKKIRKRKGREAAQEYRYSTRRTPKKQRYNVTTPKGALKAQQQQNWMEMQQTAMLNRPQQYNPYGSQEYYFDENGNLVQDQRLSEPQQMLLEQRQDTDYGLGQQAQSYLDQIQAQGQWNPQNLPEMPGAGGFDAERKRIEDEIYSREAQLIDERFTKERDQMEQALADRGIPRGSELFNKEMEDFSRRREDSHEAARQQAVSYAGAEQQSRYNMGMGARQQALGEYGQSYSMPFQSMGAMLGSQAGIQNPNFTPFQPIQVPHLDMTGTGLGYAGLSNQYNIAAMNNQTQKDIAGMNIAAAASHGGGPDPFALQQQKFEHDQALLAQQQANQPKPPSTSSQIGGALIGLGGAALGGYAAGGGWWK